MVVDLTALITLVGVALSVATFFIGRTISARRDGENAGKIAQQLESMRTDIGEIKTQLKEDGNTKIEIAAIKGDIKTLFNMCRGVSKET